MIVYAHHHLITDEALLEHEKLYKLKEPLARDLASLQDWMEIEEGGGGFLQDPEDLPWNKRTKDLVSLSNFGDEDDAFSRFFRYKLLVWYAHSRFGRWITVSNFRKLFSIRRLTSTQPPSQFGTSDYNDRDIERLVKSVLVVFTSVLPTMAIFALAYTPTQIWRLAFILLFSLFFTLCLVTFTKARAVEIFFATAAMASVQVVFIGGNGIGGGGSSQCT